MKLAEKYNRAFYPHKAHPPWPTATLLTIRMHLRFICSKGSTPSILPAARAFLLRCTLLSIWKLFWQYLQYQEPLGMPGRGTQSEVENKTQCQLKGQVTEKQTGIYVVDRVCLNDFLHMS
jgi:hypothetical protein